MNLILGSSKKSGLPSAIALGLREFFVAMPGQKFELLAVL
jgi:hypothetical protein